MSEKTCGTCAHWGVGSTPNDQEEQTIYRPCGAVIHDRNYRVKPEFDEPLSNENDNWVEVPGDDLPDSYKRKAETEIAAIRKHKAVVQDGSGFYAALKVREDFGCVLWRKK